MGFSFVHCIVHALYFLENCFPWGLPEILRAGIKLAGRAAQSNYGSIVCVSQIAYTCL